MKLLILGHFAHDVLHDSEGGEHSVCGGMHRLIERLSNLASHQDRIVPVFGIQAQEHPGVVQELRSMPNVDTGGIYAMETPTHRVHYYEQDNGTRVACVRQAADPIPFDRIKKYLDADGVLINMMSGMDLRLETLDEIRMALRGGGAKLHLDFHNLTTGMGQNGERIRRPLPTWRRWAFMVDIVQMNSEEIAGLASEPMPEEMTVGHLLTLSVKGVLVTRGAGGATLYTSEHKHSVRKDVPAPAAPPEDRPGSGDRFGAGFFLHYCKTTDAAAALEFAAAAMGNTSDSPAIQGEKAAGVRNGN